MVRIGGRIGGRRGTIPAFVRGIFLRRRKRSQDKGRQGPNMAYENHLDPVTSFEIASESCRVDWAPYVNERLCSECPSVRM